MVKTLHSKQQEIKNHFQAFGIETAALDARLLIQHALNITHEQFLMQRYESLMTEQEQRLNALVIRRMNREPIAKIIGEKEFYGRLFVTTCDTLDPRPDSETIIKAALDVIPRDSPCRILDLGTGTGCLIVTLLAERPTAIGVAVDISPSALEVAQSNAKKHNVADRLTLLQGYWFDSVPPQSFDIIISNPPYIGPEEMDDLSPEVQNYEPHVALFADEGGCSAYRAIASAAHAFLAPHAPLMVEVGHTQAQDVEKIFIESNLSHIIKYSDLSGICRVVIARNATLE